MPIGEGGSGAVGPADEAAANETVSDEAVVGDAGSGAASEAASSEMDWGKAMADGGGSGGVRALDGNGPGEGLVVSGDGAAASVLGEGLVVVLGDAVGVDMVGAFTVRVVSAGREGYGT